MDATDKLLTAIKLLTRFTAQLPAEDVSPDLARAIDLLVALYGERSF